MNPDVVFVGAGPVGLWTAIQLKLYLSDINILMLEKYEVYKRGHVLVLKKDTTFKGAHEDKEFREMIHQFPSAIRTNDLEAQLKQFALKLGIQIVYEEVTDTKALAEKYPTTKLMIGSDGTHSIVKKEIFDNDLEVNKDLQHIVEVKYEAVLQGEESKLGKTKAVIRSQTKHLVEEYVGKNKDGKTPVTLRIFIDKETYTSLKGEKGDKATFKNPVKLTDLNTKELANLHLSIATWLGAREGILSEQRLENTLKITSIPLVASSAKKLLEHRHGLYWYIEGDAALAVPFFRALNDGFIIGNEAAKYIVAYLVTMEDSYLFTLEKIAKQIMDKEISRAEIKSSVLNVAKAAHSKYSKMLGGLNDMVSISADVRIPVMKMQKELQRIDQPASLEEKIFINMKEELECICEYVGHKPGNKLAYGMHAFFSHNLFGNFNIIEDIRSAIYEATDPADLLLKVTQLEKLVISYGDFKSVLKNFIDFGTLQLMKFYKENPLISAGAEPLIDPNNNNI